MIQIYDIDGTLTTSGDTPRTDLIEHVKTEVAEDQARIFIVSGRPISRLAETEEWLKTNEETLAATALRDPNSDIKLPPSLGPASRGKITDYEAEQPGAGTSIGYSSAAVRATVYFFTLGAESIPDGIESVPVLQAFDLSLKDIEEAGRQGAYKNLSPFTKSKGAIVPDAGAITALCARCTLVQEGIAKDSAVYVFGCRNRIVKLRLTSAVAEADTAKAESTAFLKAVAGWLR